MINENMYNVYQELDSMTPEQREEVFTRFEQLTSKEDARTLRLLYLNLAALDWQRSETGRLIKDYVGHKLYLHFNGIEIE